MRRRDLYKSTHTPPEGLGYAGSKAMRGLFVAIALAVQACAGSLSVTDIDGRQFAPLRPSGPAEALFFITHDCPISNFYAPEIQRICSEYGSKGVSCALVYVDV